MAEPVFDKFRCAMNAPVSDLSDGVVRHDWTREEIGELFALPFADLIYRAQTVHRQYFSANEVQMSMLLSIKTGGCPEDCGYCSQSTFHETGLKASKLMAVDAVIADARAAKELGATRFCMGAAWRAPKDKDLDTVCEMVEGVKALGMETCVTLGMLTGAQAERLKEAGGVATPFEVVELFIDAGDDPDVAGDGTDGDVAVFKKVMAAETEEGFPGILFGRREGIDGVGLVGFAECALCSNDLRIAQGAAFDQIGEVVDWGVADGRGDVCGRDDDFEA
jgi:hypothetical protein